MKYTPKYETYKISIEWNKEKEQVVFSLVACLRILFLCFIFEWTLKLFHVVHDDYSHSFICFSCETQFRNIYNRFGNSLFAIVFYIRHVIEFDSVRTSYVLTIPFILSNPIFVWFFCIIKSGNEFNLFIEWWKMVWVMNSLYWLVNCLWLIANPE